MLPPEEPLEPEEPLLAELLLDPEVLADLVPPEESEDAAAFFSPPLLAPLSDPLSDPLSLPVFSPDPDLSEVPAVGAVLVDAALESVR